MVRIDSRHVKKYGEGEWPQAHFPWTGEMMLIGTVQAEATFSRPCTH